MKRRFLTIILSMVLTAGVLYLLPPQVSAHTAAKASPNATCSGISCDGKDPYATGCVNKAIYEAGTVLANNSGFIYLYYAPRPCDTWFGFVKSYIGSTTIYSDIYLGNGARGHTRTTNNKIQYSYMIYDGDYRVTVYVYAYVKNSLNSGVITSP